MKQLFITFFMAVAMALLAIVGCAAQTHVDQQFKRFENMVKNGDIATTSMQNVTYNDGDMTTGSCSACEFKIKRGSNIVKDIVSAMSQDESNAYHSASNTAGNQGVTYAIAYGSGKNDYVLIGADPEKNFKVVCFKNKDNNDYRISYAIEWKQDDNGNYTGKLCKVYGMKPDKMISYNDKEINVFKIDTLISTGSLKELEKLKTLKELKNFTLKGGKGNSLNLYGYSRGDNSFWTESDNWPLNDDDDDLASEWLTDFGLYCSKFKEKANQSAGNGLVYATEILQLCKHAEGVISKEEKKLCVETLKDCKGYTKDKFVIGLLDQAIGHLNGKIKAESRALPLLRKSEVQNA